MNPKRELKVTVCQLRSEREDLATDWERLVVHVRHNESDLVLLPEMPFYPWPFWRPTFSQEVWEDAVRAHEAWQQHLDELSADLVLASRPVNGSRRRLNQALVWNAGQESITLGHAKYFLPDEAGFWEASWYDRGDGVFAPQAYELPEAGLVCIGFLICSELWFMDKARQYGQAGAHLLLTPRATEKRTVDRWLAAGRTAAIIAGAYSLSSNHYRTGDAPVNLGGFGWIIGPDGEVLALTTPDRPFATVAIDLAHAERAKHTYPRYVTE